MSDTRKAIAKTLEKLFERINPDHQSDWRELVDEKCAAVELLTREPAPAAEPPLAVRLLREYRASLDPEQDREMMGEIDEALGQLACQAAPAPSGCRALLREALPDVSAWLAEYADENDSRREAIYLDRVRRIQAALAAPQCEAGEWELIHELEIKGAWIDGGYLIATPSGREIKHAGKEADLVRLYRRRAPQGGGR